MKKMTHYDTLGIEEGASEAEIRLAFRRLAKQCHPDQLEGEERRVAEKKFQTITEAFNILARPDQRERYDKEISQGVSSVGGMDPQEIAKRLAAKGAQAFKEGRSAEAIDLLRQALNHDDGQARAHYFLGLTLTKMIGKGRDGLRHLDRATQLEPNNTTMKAETAAAFLSAGMKSRAERLASEVLGLDPTNAKAMSIIERVRS
jgi:curved DNA-binding protein CbpA